MKRDSKSIVAAGYNIVVIPLAAGVLYTVGIVRSPEPGDILMSLNTKVSTDEDFLKVSE